MLIFGSVNERGKQPKMATLVVIRLVRQRCTSRFPNGGLRGKFECYLYCTIPYKNNSINFKKIGNDADNENVIVTYINIHLFEFLFLVTKKG